MNNQSTISPEGLDRAVLVWMQELSPHGICVTDETLRIQGWNLWMETVSGLKREEVIGRHLLDVFPSLRQRRMDAYFGKALKGEISVLAVAFHHYLFPFPSTVREADYPHMLQTGRIAPLLLENEVVGTITTIEDVTEREFQAAQLRKQSERQELFSWALAHLLRSSDAETMVRSIFPRVSAHMNVDVFFNYMAEEDGGKMILQCAGGIVPALKQQVTTRTIGEPFCESSAAGPSTFVLCNIQESNDPATAPHKQIGLGAYVCHPLQVEDRVIGTLSFGSRARSSFEAEEIEMTRVLAQYVAIAIERLRIVGALQKAREELSRHAESLEKKVQERTAKLQESVAELESFSYSLAHDVRAPLRHILGYARLLVEDCEAELSDEARSYVDSISRSIIRLDALTQDILAYSQLARQPVKMGAINLELLVNDVIARNPAFARPGVVHIETPLHPVIGERVLLDQCLSNLLDNALKFVPPKVEPRIVVRTELRASPGGETDRLLAQDQKRVRIWVEDNGIGIAPEFHGKIFGIFERLVSHSHGTGIGLAIVSKAVDRMGGTVGLESEEQKGSRFWFELPAAEPKSA